MMASERLGLYLVSGKGERTAFCDIHSYGALLDRAWHEVFYTGPGQKSITAIKHRRTAGEIAAYENHHEVALENDIAMGGRALFMHSRKRKSYDAALIVELGNYATRKIFTKIDQRSRKMSYRTEFPKAPAGHFNRCKVLQTGFHLQAARTATADAQDLKEAREGAHPAILRNPFVRVEWKVESAIAAQNDCALYEQEGL